MEGDILYFRQLLGGRLHHRVWFAASAMFRASCVRTGRMGALLLQVLQSQCQVNAEGSEIAVQSRSKYLIGKIHHPVCHLL